MVGHVLSRMMAGAVGGGLAIGGWARSPRRRPSPVRPDGTRRAVFVGNNWGGTADILAPDTLRRLGTIDVVPDYDGADAGDPERPLPAGVLPRDPHADR